MLSRYRIKFLSALLLLIAVACTAIALVSARTASRPAPQMKIEERAATQIDEGLDTQAHSSQPEAAQGSSEKEEMEAEVVAIRRGGFEPKELTRSRGPFLLVVDNRSGVEISAFEIRHEDGSLRHSMRARAHKISWQQVLDLPPGHYLLQAPEYLNITCLLNITAR